MAKEEEEKYFKELDLQIESLRKHGRDLGLSDIEINACMLKASKERINGDKHKTLVSKLMRICKLTLFIWAFVLLFVMIFYFLVTYNKSVQLYVGRVLAPYGYSIFRAIRLTFLPLTINTNITKYYEEECLIYNPYFDEQGAECDLCKLVREVEERSQYAEFDFNMPAQPFINRQVLTQPVTFQDLKKAYEENKETFQSYGIHFKSNENSIKSFQDLFKVDCPVELQKQIGDKLHIEFVSRKVAGAQVLRKMFPRPHFVPADSEVALEKYIFLDGPKGRPYKFALAQFSNVWYVQGQGSRTLHLTPTGNCFSECKNFEVTLKARDILFYSDQFWKVISLPVQQSQEISVGFTGSFF